MYDHYTATLNKIAVEGLALSNCLKSLDCLANSLVLKSRRLAIFLFGVKSNRETELYLFHRKICPVISRNSAISSNLFTKGTNHVGLAMIVKPQRANIRRLGRDSICQSEHAGKVLDTLSAMTEVAHGVVRLPRDSQVQYRAFRDWRPQASQQE